MKFTRVRYFDAARHFSYGDITVEHGRIVAVEPRSETPDPNADFLIPGLCDVHLHGCAGADCCDGEPDSLARMATALANEGVTSFCPATMALPEEKLLRACRLAAEYAEHPLPNGAVMRGVTLEGPFLSAEKCGAQAPAYLRKPDAALFYRLQEASGHRIRTVCVAPELEESDSFIKAVSSEGITVSLAHTACTYEQAAKAFDAGASCVTHLFNAMGAFTHRAPGVLGAAAERNNVFVELIGDGVHLHPATVRLTFRLFGSTRICLISDSMAACGLADGQYQLGGQAVTVQGNRATLADGTLAGSVANLFSVMKRAIEMGISPEDAVTSSALTPAKRLSAAHEAGLILPNYRADVVLCSHHFEKKGVWIEGREIN